MNDCDHFWDYPKPFVLEPLQVTTQTGRRRNWAACRKRVCSRSANQEICENPWQLRTTGVTDFETLDSHKGRQRPLDHKACCGSRRIWAIHLDEHLERELFPISLSIATPNGSLRTPLAKFDLRNILQDNDCQRQSTISNVALYALFSHCFICKTEACTIIDALAPNYSLWPMPLLQRHLESCVASSIQMLPPTFLINAPEST